MNRTLLPVSIWDLGTVTAADVGSLRLCSLISCALHLTGQSAVGGNVSSMLFNSYLCNV
jgi:hypothetical protein